MEIHARLGQIDGNPVNLSDGNREEGGYSFLAWSHISNLSGDSRETSDPSVKNKMLWRRSPTLARKTITTWTVFESILNALPWACVPAIHESYVYRLHEVWMKMWAGKDKTNRPSMRLLNIRFQPSEYTVCHFQTSLGLCLWLWHHSIKRGA